MTEKIIDSPLWGFVVAGAVFVLFVPLLTSPGPGVTVDLPSWTLVGNLLATQVFPDQRWFSGIVLPAINAGQDLGWIYSMVLMLLWLLNQLFSPAVAVKALCVLSALVYALGVHAVCRRVCREAFAAFTAVVALLAGGDLILQGMWYNLLAIGFAFLFWSLLLQPAGALPARSWIFAVLLYAAAIYTHPLGAIAATAAWAAVTGQRFLVASGGSGRAEAWFVAAIFPCALLVAAPQLAGVLSVHQGGGAGVVITPEVAGPLAERLFTLGDLRWSAGWAARVAVGLVFLAVAAQLARPRELPREFAVTLAMLIVATGTIMLEKPLNVLADCCRVPFAGTLAYFSDRFRYLWGPLVLVLFAVSLSRQYERYAAPAGTQSAAAGSRGVRRFEAARAVRQLAAGLLLITVAYLGMQFVRSPNQLTLESVREKEEIHELWARLKDLQSPDTRFCFEPAFHDYEMTGDTVWSRSRPIHSHVLALTPLYVPGTETMFTGFADLLTYIYSRTRHDFLGVSMSGGKGLPLDTVDETMRRLNCRYAISYSGRVKSALAGLKSIAPVATAGRFTVYRNDSFVPAWAYDAAAPRRAYRLERNATNDYTLHYDGKGASAHVALAYSAGWTAAIGDRQVPLREDTGMLRVELPETSGDTAVRLRFGDRIAKGPALSLLALGGALLLVVPFAFRRGISRGSGAR